MFKRLTQAAILAGSMLALGACTLGESKTAAAPVKPPAADYQRLRSAVASCGPDQGDLLQRGGPRHRARAHGAAGTSGRDPAVPRRLAVPAPMKRSMPISSASTAAEFATNARSLSQIAGRKRFNTDVFVTEVANRTAQRAPTDKEFCSARQARLRLGDGSEGDGPGPGAAAVRPRPRDEHPSPARPSKQTVRTGRDERRSHRDRLF